MNNTFWQLMRESVITQSVLTVMVWGAIVYLCAIQQPVPEVLQLGGTAILGFWFGSKTAMAALQGIKATTQPI